MKVCSTCQSSYPDGFKYCPQDNTTLLTSEEYARRTEAAAVITPTVSEVVRAEVMREAVPEVAVNVNAPEVQTAAQYIAPRDVEYKVPPQPIPSTPVVTDSKPTITAAVPPSAKVAAASAATNGAASAATADDFGLNLALPEPDGLVSRLIASLKNIKDNRFFGGNLAPGTTQGFEVMIPDESLTSRVAREVGLAWADLRRNPKQFFVELVRGDGSNLRRRNMMLAGSEMAIIGYGTIYMSFHALALLGKEKPMMFNVICIALSAYLIACYAVRGFLLSRIINKFTQGIAVPKLGLEVANWVPLIALLVFVFTSDRWFCQVFPAQCPVVQAKNEEFRLLEPTLAEEPKVEKKIEKIQKEIPKGKGDGFTGGSKPKPQQAQGGGGQNTPAPASKGVPPQMTQIPQVMPPTLRPPTVKNPSLVVAPTLQGDDKLSIAKAGPVGLENGADAPPALGRGKGTGLGDGDGGGKGPGSGGNTGGGNMGIGGGAGTGGSGGQEVFTATAGMKPQILYQEKAKYTESARQNRVQGTVVVSVVFTADGRVSGARVVRGLPDGLNDEAIKAAQKIKFRPAMKNGQPVSVRMAIEFTFNLL
jgi:TonB family protein